MEDRPGYLNRWGVKARFRVLFVGLSLLSALGFILFATLATRMSGQVAEEQSTQIILQQTRDSLLQLTQRSAQAYHLTLQSVQNDAWKLSKATAAIFQNPEVRSRPVFWQASEHMIFGPAGQYMNGSEDVSSVFVPNTQEINQDVIDDIELSAYIETMLLSVMDTNPDIEAVYFASTRDMVRYYPNADLGKVLPVDFKASTRPWYQASAMPNNPSRKPVWTDPYIDATGLGLVTTAASPVYNSKDELIGVIGIDLTLNNLKASIEQTRFLGQGYLFLLHPSGQVIALPEQGYPDILGVNYSEDQIFANASTISSPFTSVIEDMMAGKTGLQQVIVNDIELFVAYTPIESTGWSLGSVIETGAVLANLVSLQTTLRASNQVFIVSRVLPISLVILAIVILASFSFVDRVVEPLKNLAAQAARFGSGDWELTLPVQSTDEIGVLARAMHAMLDQLKGFVQGLEDRIDEQTSALRARTTQLQAASTIARDAATIQDAQVLMNQAVNLVQDQFGFYHVGIFLLDDQKEYAVLQAATGEAGRKMLDYGHRLRVGQQGIVGYVIGTGHPRIANHVERDPTHYKNPLLPNTRAEMALVLRVADQVIGALDVQSDKPDAFSNEDINILQTLADQLAVAIQNARLLSEYQNTLKSLEMTYSDISQRGWSEKVRTEANTGFEYNRGFINRLNPDPSNPGANYDSAKGIVKAPIQLRGKTIAVIEVSPGASGLTTEELLLIESIAERISQSLESARMFEVTQESAESGLIVAQITTKMRETLDIETILRTFSTEVRQALDLAEVEVRLGKPPIPEILPDNGRSK